MLTNSSIGLVKGFFFLYLFLFVFERACVLNQILVFTPQKFDPSSLPAVSYFVLKKLCFILALMDSRSVPSITNLSHPLPTLPTIFGI